MKPASRRSRTQKRDTRILLLRGVFFLCAVIVSLKLFHIQVVNASFYDSLASGQHSFYQELFSERGNIYVKDWRDGRQFFAATNEPRGFIYADPRKVEDPLMTAKELSRILGHEIRPSVEELKEQEVKEEALVEAEGEAILEPQEPEIEINPYQFYDTVFARLSKENDPYEPIARDVEDVLLQQIVALELPGIYHVLEKGRAYPEKSLGGHIFGFLGLNSAGERVGQYGIEGAYNDFLAGQNGYIDSQKDASGRWIGIGSREFVPAVDGGDILLTVDRTVQYMACKKLKEGVERFGALSGTVVIMEPQTGKIMAMCNVPDYDPNQYNKVEDISVYTNRAVSTPYEPGSVFKPLIMAAGIDQGLISPTSTFEDLGEEKIDRFTIRNSDKKAHGIQTMTYVLEKSLNTGMIFVMRKLGFDQMKNYIEKFGFGTASGIELTGEAAGTIEALNIKSEIYYATASYGQGITATPLQIAVAFSALANGGKIMKPYIIEELHLPNGEITKKSPETIRQVISKKTATTISAMLVSVVENGYDKTAVVPGYYIAGKTGTAQVSGEGGYIQGHTMATFAGYGPVENPAFVMVVLLDKPTASEWASGTSTVIFADIAEFLLQYLQIPPTRL